jgi:hypothetical protein
MVMEAGPSPAPIRRMSIPASRRSRAISVVEIRDQSSRRRSVHRDADGSLEAGHVRDRAARFHREGQVEEIGGDGGVAARRRARPRGGEPVHLGVIAGQGRDAPFRDRGRSRRRRRASGQHGQKRGKRQETAGQGLGERQGRVSSGCIS